jgi:hypothetical protein
MSMLYYACTVSNCVLHTRQPVSTPFIQSNNTPQYNTLRNLQVSSYTRISSASFTGPSPAEGVGVVTSVWILNRQIPLAICWHSIGLHYTPERRHGALRVCIDPDTPHTRTISVNYWFSHWDRWFSKCFRVGVYLHSLHTCTEEHKHCGGST